MGQYYYIVNVDKRQYLHPHKLGDGLKLLEFACSTPGTMTALAVLLADGNGRGGGDLNVVHDPYNLVGSWAGDRIVVAGDYADEGVYGAAPDDDPPRDDEGRPLNLYSYAARDFCDISDPVRELICQDSWVKGQIGESWTNKESDFDPTHKHAPKLATPEAEAEAEAPEIDPLEGF